MEMRMLRRFWSWKERWNSSKQSGENGKGKGRKPPERG